MIRLYPLCLLQLLLTPAIYWAGDGEQSVIDIGSRRELFVDDLLIGRLDGTELKLHEPQHTLSVAHR